MKVNWDSWERLEKDALVPAEDALVCKYLSGTQILCRHLNEASQQPKKKIK